jgi:phosphonate transport system ATP-binding protein
MQPILHVKDLRKEYADGTVALKNVSFDVGPGEFVVIIGPSGAGKSTLLRCINRLVTPTDGKIEFKGLNVNKANHRQVRRVRREIGMVFQGFNLIQRVSVLNNVLNGRLGYMNTFRGAIGWYTRDDVEEALNILDRVGLGDQVYKRADELSGGQMQRVGISRALAQHPELILADEPIASLDPASSENIMDYMYKICREDGITSLVNLHQVEVAKKYATRIIGIHKGEVVFDGSPSKLSSGVVEHIYYGVKESLAGSR